MHERDDPQDESRRRERDDEESTPGAEGGEHPDAAPVPFAPHEDDDSPLGDTDQHSDA